MNHTTQGQEARIRTTRGSYLGLNGVQPRASVRSALTEGAANARHARIFAMAGGVVRSEQVDDRRSVADLGADARGPLADDAQE